MNRIQEIKHWLEEGDLNRAEKAIESCTTNLNPKEKEEFEKILDLLSVRHFRLLAGKAIISKDLSLLQTCVDKLREKNASVEGLQNSLNQIISDRRAVFFQQLLMIVFGLIAFVFVALFFFI